MNKQEFLKQYMLNRIGLINETIHFKNIDAILADGLYAWNIIVSEGY